MLRRRLPAIRSAASSVVAVATLALAVSCRSTTEPAAVTRVVVGTLAPLSRAPLQVPDTAFVGIAFDARVRTQGNPCVQAAGGEAKVRGLVATVTPYDMVYNGQCIEPLVYPTRTVPVRFDVPGTAAVRAVGANGTTAERTVVVLPLR